MKKLLIISVLAFVASIVSSAQVVDDGSRDRSKYATYSFSRDDRYTYEDPYETVSVKQPKGKKVKNIIYMIGDGMGFEQVSFAWVLNGGKLNLDNFLYTGVCRTYAVDSLVTDSCAAGTALACGQKTKYHYMGVDEDGQPLTSVLRTAQSKGKKTGISVTCRINDATPADFYCHTKDRSLEEEVTEQYLDSGIDFLSGGGLKFWVDRKDGRNLVEEMQSRGYTFVDTDEKLKAAGKGPLLGLFADTEMAPALERGPILEDSAVKAIELLDNKKGFFLMIEGSCIDDWGHKQKAGYIAEEIFDFDRTIGKVLEWAEKDGETLVIVTADHATGGMTMLSGSIEKRTAKVKFTTKGHNGIFTPVFAYGPHAEDFVGVHENAEIAEIIRRLIK